MKCLLLGEGPSDLGANDDFAVPRFRKGPMIWAIDSLASRRGFDGIDYALLSRGEVSRGIRQSHRGISARPKEVDPEHRAIYQSAWYLGKTALAEGKDMAVFFHDADRTRSAPCDQARKLEEAMDAGFAVAGFFAGVPMIPVPRSEAWLLACFQKGLARQSAYNHAERFENLPANDQSPNLAKKLLQAAVGAESEADTYSKVMDEIADVNWSQVKMPSFNRFRERLEYVLDALIHPAGKPVESARRVP